MKAVNADAAFKARHAHRRGQLDQLGARRGAGRLLLRGLLRGHAQQRRAGRLRRAFGQLRQHPRRARRARDGPADPPPDPRHQRERRARRVLPHRPLPSAPAARDARHVVAVDGHLQGVELRALRLRRGGPRSGGACATLWTGRQRRAASTCAGTPYWPRVQSPRLRVAAQHARRPHRDHPRRRRELRHRRSIRTPPTASRSAASCATRRAARSASRPRCR